MASMLYCVFAFFKGCCCSCFAHNNQQNRSDTVRTADDSSLQLPRDQRQLQVDLTHHFPSAPKMDSETSPPSYKEAISMKS